MRTRFSQSATALLLVFSIWMSALVVVAAPQQQQSTPPQDQKQTASQDKKQGQQPAAPAQTSNRGPLKTDEDPAMIGKRKINSGLIAKMAGSTEREVATGRMLAAEIDKQVKFVDDPIVTEYINRVGQNIVLHSDAKVPFTIKVIDTDEVNAFALPGGFFYVNRGLILAADNEAELAGVMAHEIAHVAARHAMENQAKATLMEYGALAGSIFLGGWPALIFQNTAGLAMLLGFMKFSRSAEEEADRLGVQYLYAAGYDPTAMATMFEKLASQNKKKPGFISKAFASHPQAPERRAASLALVARFPEREEYIISTSEFQRVKNRLMRLSNARITTAGDISGSDDSTPGRPTLKRRGPSTENPQGDQGPSDSTPTEPPKLKRNEGPPQQPAATPPPATP